MVVALKWLNIDATILDNIAVDSNTGISLDVIAPPRVHSTAGR